LKVIPFLTVVCANFANFGRILLNIPAQLVLLALKDLFTLLTLLYPAGVPREVQPHCCWDKSNITYACGNFKPQVAHHSWPLCFDKLKVEGSKCLVYSFGASYSHVFSPSPRTT
jgi:hypothetical protein